LGYLTSAILTAVPLDALALVILGGTMSPLGILRLTTAVSAGLLICLLAFSWRRRPAHAGPHRPRPDGISANSAR